MTTLACRELVELVTDYLEHALPLEEQRRFEAHVERCGGCQAYLDQMRLTLNALGRLHRAYTRHAREDGSS